MPRQTRNLETRHERYLAASRAPRFRSLSSGYMVILFSCAGFRIILVALGRLCPLNLVKLPARLQLELNLPASLRLNVLLELDERDVAVTVRVERVEHGFVDLHLGAITLGQAHRAEGALELPHGELAIAVGVKALEDIRHVVLLVAGHRRVPRRLVELPTGLEGELDLAARLRLQVLIELLHAHVAIAVRVERLEHFLVHLHLRAIALGQAQGTEGARNLVDVELAVTVGVELRKDLFHVPLLVALYGRIPLLLVELPAHFDLLFDLCPQLVVHVGVDLLHVHVAVLVCTKRLERCLVHVRIPALALLEADRTEGTRKLIDVELAIAVGVKLRKECRHAVLALLALPSKHDPLLQGMVLHLDRFAIARARGRSARATTHPRRC
ncbi:hypothetical protein Ctob_004362, partial [Chrysochromulina tobinii]